RGPRGLATNPFERSSRPRARPPAPSQLSNRWPGQARANDPAYATGAAAVGEGRPFVGRPFLVPPSFRHGSGATTAAGYHRPSWTMRRVEGGWHPDFPNWEPTPF